MAKLPVVSGAKLVKALYKLGYQIDRQRGSHIILVHPLGTTLVVPNHKEVRKGTLAGILKDARITGDDLRRLL